MCVCVCVSAPNGWISLIYTYRLQPQPHTHTHIQSRPVVSYRLTRYTRCVCVCVHVLAIGSKNAPHTHTHKAQSLYRVSHLHPSSCWEECRTTDASSHTPVVFSVSSPTIRRIDGKHYPDRAEGMSGYQHRPIDRRQKGIS